MLKEINEFWTSKQRQGKSLHEISYRACFKSELPNYFIEKFTIKGDVVYDPFAGRGTSLIEAGLLGRKIISNDINPLSKILSEPRFFIPDLLKIENRTNKILKSINFSKENINMSMFYHKKTLNEILKMKYYFINKKELDITDKWIKMLITSRLTGHSKGFLSVYTLPPNQSVSQKRQILINEKYKQKPDYRSLKTSILKKTKSLLRNIDMFDIENLNSINNNLLFLSKAADNTIEIKDESIDLIITSPPFLDVVNYKNDNWIRMWFNDIPVENLNISMFKKIEDWENYMKKVFLELFRICKIGGFLAFEVGEIRNKKVFLEDVIEKISHNTNFILKKIYINKSNFTKTANIWGVNNNEKGTNTNRILLFKKEKI